ncbi:MAG TPA: cytochrome c3 family protein [Gemmatimonadota bacterium]|nr:cytochrome c3 family protein [Gemmatimonadota bacterium]
MTAKDVVTHARRAGRLGLAGFWMGGLSLLLVAACTDETIIEVERPFFEDPPAEAGGVLGFDEVSVNLTVCGNCHVGQQSGWEETAHADAFDALGANPAESCTECHAVTERGNASEGQIGFASTHDPRYQDVQCESCHGPGATHVSNPDVDSSHPLASIAVPVEDVAGALNGCGECHGGAHQPIAEQWALSPHAVAVASPAANPACQQCHRGQQILAAWGEEADYLEKDDAEHQGIVCAVCHDPHGATHPGQLRFPVDTPALEQNLCARCHNRRALPDPLSARGPHAPQAPLLIGDAGWFPPGANIDPGQILATHGTDRNPRFCATCHLPKFQISDPLRPGSTIESTSHFFGPIPCLDAQGQPLPFSEECDLAPPARSYKACTGGACHGTEQVAFSALIAATTRIQRAADDLLGQLQQVDPNLGTAGGEISAGDPFTVADGSFFNYNLAIFGSHSGRGSAVHNPFLVEALLIASIAAVEEEYGVSANRVVDWDAELERVLTSARTAH